MDTNSHNGHPAVNTDVRYDHSDLSVRGIIIFLVGVGLAGIFTHLVIWGIYEGAKKFTPYTTNPNPMMIQETAPEAPPLQNAGPQTVVKFPEPRLQTDDTADMSKFKEQEEIDLHPTQPYRTGDGAVHIDINQAMALIAQRGLPTRQPGQENATPQTDNNKPKQNAPAPQSGAKATGGSQGAK